MRGGGSICQDTACAPSNPAAVHQDTAIGSRGPSTRLPKGKLQKLLEVHQHSVSHCPDLPGFTSVISQLYDSSEALHIQQNHAWNSGLLPGLPHVGDPLPRCWAASASHSSLSATSHEGDRGHFAACCVAKLGKSAGKVSQMHYGLPRHNHILSHGANPSLSHTFLYMQNPCPALGWNTMHC